MKNVKKRLLIGLISALFLISDSSTAKTEAATEPSSPSVAVSTAEVSYYEYISSFDDAEFPSAEISVSLDEFTATDDADISYGVYNNRDNVLIWNNGKGSAEFKISVQSGGLYQIAIDYFAIPSDSVSNPEFELYIDGEYPFMECKQITIPRIWCDETYISYKENDFKTDNRGNDVTPNPVDANIWNSFKLRDDTGANREPYYFYLSSGEHTVRFVSLRDPVAISGISLKNTKESPNYSEYEKTTDGEKLCDVFVEIEAEKTALKTSPSIYPIADKTSTANTPLDPYASRLNAIGGTNWSSPMQSITWEFNVPTDGYYKIGFRFRQNYLRGIYTARCLEIDGEVLFSELQDVRFPYSGNWQLKVLGDGEPFLIYLKKGMHTLTMIPTVTELADDISSVDNTVSELDELYSNIIMVTGTDPDIYRDYYLDETIPGLVEGMAQASDILFEVSEHIQAITGNKGGMSATLDRVYEQLKSFIKSPDSIPGRLSNFQSNISSLASWVLELREQSLLLDKIYLVGAQDEFPDVNFGFLQSTSYHVKSFISSFTGDYTSIGNTYDKDKAVYIWLNGSRDVAGVLKTLIDSDFTDKTGICVNANLSTTSLLAAVMADKGPDVAISVGRSEPVNLAARGAVEELDGFNEIVEDFSESALTPYIYQGKCYALPVTQSFLMMFYREDILSKLKLDPPKTWNEVYSVAETLQRNNMNIGIPGDLFYTLLFQMGGSLYNESLTATSFDTQVSFNAFKMWCDFYTQYGLPLYKDDYNRFRTGELPIVITGYSFYNQLYATAPTIRNMWKMTEIPGVEDENGNINNTSAASGSACVLLKNAKNRDNAWQFMKWWVIGETQGTYASHIESMLGVISRATPASRTAMSRIAWSNSEAAVLNSQWSKVKETEEIPGSYYTTRNISNAFNEVYYGGSNPRQTLNAWNNEINSELERKRKEFEYAEK